MKLFLFIILSFSGTILQSQDFNILAQGIGRRALVTNTISSGDFTIGINKWGGGYITQIDIPGVGNILGNQASRYGRGGQSSIRDLVRSGQYNPTQAGFSDEAGTIVTIITEPNGKLIIPSRGCVLFNGDGKYDFTEWENITKDPVANNDNGNSDDDGIDESNLQVTIDGVQYNKQQAEVYSDFDFYGEYEDFSPIANLSTPAIRHYFEYKFIRSSTKENSAIKQFSQEAIKDWDSTLLSDDISVNEPKGLFPGGAKHLNEVQLTWSTRNDISIWNPEYRHVQLNDGTWSIQNRTNPSNGRTIFVGNKNEYKLRVIISDSDDDNVGQALGMYLPDSEINTNNIVGVRERDGSVIYVDNRTTHSEFRENRARIPTMALMAFRSRLNGIIDRSELVGKYQGVYEKIRSEVIILQGTTAEIKTAFVKLDDYYTNTLSFNNFELDNILNFYPNPSNDKINIILKNNKSNVSIYNLLGKKVYSWKGKNKEVSIPVEQIGAKGVYILKVDNISKKLIIK